MVREKQLSLCFDSVVEIDSLAVPGRAAPSVHDGQAGATVLRLDEFKHRRASEADVSRLRLLEKIARKVKFF